MSVSESNMDEQINLSRRERQIMDIIYACGEPSVNEIQQLLPDPPSHTAVRTFLKILEDKGHAKRRKRGREYLYRAKRTRKRAGLSAMRRVLHTFFDGSLGKALSAQLADGKTKLSPDELEQVARLINEARKQGD